MKLQNLAGDKALAVWRPMSFYSFDIHLFRKEYVPLFYILMSSALDPSKILQGKGQLVPRKGSHMTRCQRSALVPS